MSKKVLITAGLPYSNGDLHVGHMAGCYLPGDICNRYLKLNNVQTKYVCGSDDHGVAIVISAKQKGMTPEEVVEYYKERQIKAFKGFMIDFDVFGSTSQSKYHKDISHEFFLKLLEKGCFTKDSTEQFYDPGEKTFLPDRYVKGTCAFCGAEDQNGDQCEQCGKMLDVETLKDPKSSLSGESVEKKETTHWFIDLSQFEQTVADWLEVAQIRTNTKSFVKGLLGAGLVKRSMTRDLSWGLPVPLDDPDAKDKVLYVWFDAPIGYISNTKELLIDQGEEAYKDWWNSEDTEILHFIGEDNTVFHCIIWIAMLHAHGNYSLPTGVIVNHFMNIKKDGNVEKISKSKNNTIGILDYLEAGSDPDYLRYYLTMISPEKTRTYFDVDEFIAGTNSDLADTLGNFINRVFTFSNKYFDGQMPEVDESRWGELEKELNQRMQDCHKVMSEQLGKYSTRNALREFFNLARFGNKYFNDKAPWSARKTDPEDAAMTIAMSLRAVYVFGVLLQPFMPIKSQKILGSFAVDAQVLWGQCFDYPVAGTHVTSPGILFPKIEPTEATV